MPPDVKNLADQLLHSQVHVAVAEQATTVDKVSQQVFFVDSQSKDKLLLDLLKSEEMDCVLVFTKTKHRANKLAEFLNKNRVRASAIHGNKSQTHRTAALREFKEGKVRVLVATDIAARGIDIENISHVVNFELPNIPESYVHRIGRTARAGAAGAAYSFCAADERDFLRDIEKLIRQEIEQVTDHPHHSEIAKNARGVAAKPNTRFTPNSRGRKRFDNRDPGRSHGTHRGNSDRSGSGKNRPGQNPRHQHSSSNGPSRPRFRR
jgi:ATP-dependent RNA helicase RhlE